MLEKWNILPKLLQGQKQLRSKEMRSNFGPEPHFFVLIERGDQGLSGDGKHDLVRCLERWQIVLENGFFLQNN